MEIIGIAYLNGTSRCKKEEANEAYIKVSFDDTDEIVHDEEMVKDAFSVYHNIEGDDFVLLNEGLQVNYELDDNELTQLKEYVNSLPGHIMSTNNY